MGLNLSVELFAQNDPVLAISQRQLLLGIAGIPDSSFLHETESRAMNDHRPAPTESPCRKRWSRRRFSGTTRPGAGIANRPAAFRRCSASQPRFQTRSAATSARIA